MAIFAVLYRYTDDAAGRDEHRAAHRAFLNSSGWTLLSGPLSEPAGALLVITAPSLEAAEQALTDDPFQREGLIAERTIRSFDPVGGDLAPAFALYREERER